MMNRAIAACFAGDMPLRKKPTPIRWAERKIRDRIRREKVRRFLAAWRIVEAAAFLFECEWAVRQWVEACLWGT